MAATGEILATLRAERGGKREAAGVDRVAKPGGAITRIEHLELGRYRPGASAHVTALSMIVVLDVRLFGYYAPFERTSPQIDDKNASAWARGSAF
jgi:hypothetical protein